MKTFKEFLNEARVNTDKAQKAFNKKSSGIESMSDSDKTKLKVLLSDIKEIESKSDVSSGKYAKQLSSLEKKIANLSTKYSLTLKDIEKLK